VNGSRSIAGIALAATLASCSGSPTFTAQPDLGGSAALSAVARFEAERAASPGAFVVRLKLGNLYYLLAREALESGDEAGYREQLALAQREILEATRIDPSSPQTHALMGVIRVYEGDLDAARTCFRNALQLNLHQPEQIRQFEGVHYTNLAHLAVYQGKIADARRYLEKARPLDPPATEVERIELLAAWRENDLVEARDIFAGAVRDVPGFAETWDDAPLPARMNTFYNFAEVCCANPTCGPHMADACVRERKKVQYRKLQIETQREEQRLEQQRRLELETIYENRRDLQITLDDPSAPAPSVNTVTDP